MIKCLIYSYGTRKNNSLCLKFADFFGCQRSQHLPFSMVNQTCKWTCFHAKPQDGAEKEHQGKKFENVKYLSSQVLCGWITVKLKHYRTARSLQIYYMIEQVICTVPFTLWPDIWDASTTPLPLLNIHPNPHRRRSWSALKFKSMTRNSQRRH